MELTGSFLSRKGSCSSVAHYPLLFDIPCALIFVFFLAVEGYCAR